MSPTKARASSAKEPGPSARGAPTVGAAAPAFSLPSDSGENVSLAEYRGKWVVLYFYPKDHTSGCTRQAIDFQAAADRLRKKGAVVLGVSRDSIASHCSFKEKQRLKFPLLSDPTVEVHKRYGAYGDKMMYGKKVTGAIRTTALIGPDGRLVKYFSPVRVDGHVEAVLAAIDQESRA